MRVLQRWAEALAWLAQVVWRQALGLRRSTAAIAACLAVRSQ